MRANETAAMYMSPDGAKADRKLFVHNLGELLSQTREDVISCELDDNEMVTITFISGGTRRVNVDMDSYTAIIRDVAKAV